MTSSDRHWTVRCFPPTSIASVHVRFTVAAAASIVELYTRFVNRLEELDLPSTLDAKPLLDVRATALAFCPFTDHGVQGKAICRILDRKPGPWVAGVASKVLEWQLDHPDATSAGCEEWLAGQWREGRIELAEPAQKRASESEEKSSKKQKVG